MTAWFREGVDAQEDADGRRTLAKLSSTLRDAWDCMAGCCLIEEGGRVLRFPLGDGLIRPTAVLGARPGTYETLLELTRLADGAI